MKIPENRLRVCGDADRLFQVFTNLIGNALKFTETGHIEISARDREDRVECSIADTGSGISKEDQASVFDKFHQLKQLSEKGEKGTGLGLAIVKSIIELHKGKIWVESEIGKGTKFIFTLQKP